MFNLTTVHMLQAGSTQRIGSLTGCHLPISRNDQSRVHSPRMHLQGFFCRVCTSASPPSHWGVSWAPSMRSEDPCTLFSALNGSHNGVRKVGSSRCSLTTPISHSPQTYIRLILSDLTYIGSVCTRVSCDGLLTLRSIKPLVLHI